MALSNDHQTIVYAGAEEPSHNRIYTSEIGSWQPKVVDEYFGEDSFDPRFTWAPDDEYFAMSKSFGYDSVKVVLYSRDGIYKWLLAEISSCFSEDIS